MKNILIALRDALAFILAGASIYLLLVLMMGMGDLLK